MTAEPTPDVYRQIIKMIEDLEVVGVTDAQIEKAVREYLEENPVTGVDEAEVQRIVAEYIDLYKEELKGDKGDKGDTGANGKDGTDGVDGANGADGKSAYDIAVDNGFEGTEAEWLESLKGKDGEGSDGIAWSEESVLLLKDILYSCVDSTEKAKVDLLIGELLPNYEPEEPDEPSTELIEVGKTSEYQYQTIKEAEAVVSDGGTIRIYEGEYEEYGIGTVDKSITYEGVDKEKCIVLNGLSDKMYSVFDLANGNKTVKNITIHQTHSNPQNPDTETVAYKAYAVHCDSPSNEGKSYLIENCVLKNKYFACCGFGLWQDHTITVKDCDIDLYDSNRDITNTGAYYCHNNTYSDGVTGQRISLVNNTIHANQSKAIRIDTASQEGSEMVCEFINNTCTSDLYGTSSDCVSFAPNEHTILTETSVGNNIAKLNYEVEEEYTAPEGLKDTGYWFIAYDKSADKWYAANSESKITRAYKHASTLALMMTIENGNAKNNGWTSNDGIAWSQTLTDYVQYNKEVKLRSLNESMYNNDIVLIDAWSDTEFSWEY